MIAVESGTRRIVARVFGNPLYLIICELAHNLSWSAQDQRAVRIGFTFRHNTPRGHVAGSYMKVDVNARTGAIVDVDR